MGLYMVFPIAIWWTANQDWFFDRYIKSDIEVKHPDPPPIWETMYRKRVAAMEANQSKTA